MERKRGISKKNMKKILFLLILLICLIFVLINNEYDIYLKNNIDGIKTYSNTLEIPEYKEKIYITINDNIPQFNQSDYTTDSFERYSKLDKLGRCGTAFANISKETMPNKNEERESISHVYPTGWEQEKYNGEYLYNRCHLIGYQLTAENDNELNLITGTRYFNVSGMLPFENIVAEYLEKNENNHVLYRVTPIFKGSNLLVSGVQIEAYSVEDNGEGVCFNVYVYNVQEGVLIDYKTGESSLEK